MHNKTIIYYTASRESPEFEKQVTDGILAQSAGCPIISVSQKPMDFGTNICVGDVGHTYLNAFRQLLIGAKAATTEYVVMAESDCFYPPTGYFDYQPTDPNVIYTYDNCWIVWQNGNDRFYHKEQTHASIIYGREFLINMLENSFKGLPEWSREKIGFPFYTPEHRFIHFTGTAIVHVKTGKGVQKGTKTSRTVQPRLALDYWGTAKDFKQRYLHD